MKVFRSVKVRLTLWYALILTILLAFFGLFMYTEFSRVLYRDTDKNLQNEARLISESIGNFVDTMPKSFFGQAKTPTDAEVRKILETWETSTRRILRSPLIIRIVRENHTEVLNHLSGWQREIIFPDFERDSLFMERHASYQTIHFMKKPVRLYYFRFHIPRLDTLIIQVASPLEEARQALDRLAFIVWVSVPVAVAAACVVGWIFVRRALEPVDGMIREARQITAAYLQTRLPRTHVRDEIDRLAETLNEMMDRIEVSTRSVREFSSDVSHELKTPLAIIKGEIDLALRRSRSSETLIETLKTIGGEVDEMIRLVDDLMLLVRSDARQLKFEKKRLSMDLVLGQVAERLKDRAVKKQLDLKVKLEPDIEMMGDEVYLKRLFSNLIDNAIKFTPEGGSIETSLKRKGKDLEVRIKDTGIGIEPEAQAKIFSRFYRTDQARSYEGAGLGLNIAQTISDAHGGTLKIESSPGSGTTLIVIFPAI